MSSTLAMALSLLSLSILDPRIARDPFSSKAASEPSKILKDVCNHTKYYDFCVDTIGSDPKSHSADLVGIVTIAIKLAVESHYVQELWRNATGDPDLVQFLSLSNVQLNRAVEELESKDYATATDSMGRSVMIPKTCENRMREMHQQLTALSNMNHYTSKLLDVGLVLFQPLA
ncbi:hypothetical protein AMTRI_Chr04g180540 [Amborella trichopoda]